jgi:hypothetical protein
MSKRARKLACAFAVLTMLIIATVATRLVLQSRAPKLPPLDAPNEVLVKFCASDDFAKLPLEQQEPYVKHLMDQGFFAIIAAAQNANLSQDERQKGLQNTMQAGMNVRWGQHLDEWLKLDEAGKAAYVQEVIAEMPARPRGMDPRGAARSNRLMTPQQHKKFVEGMAPQRRAQLAEFMQQIDAARGDGGR